MVNPVVYYCRIQHFHEHVVRTSRVLRTNSSKILLSLISRSSSALLQGKEGVVAEEGVVVEPCKLLQGTAEERVVAEPCKLASGRHHNRVTGRV